MWVQAQVRAQRPDFRKFIQKILDNDPSLGECGSRVLRLKPTLDLDTSFFEIEMVLEALRYNWRVQALYIHNFEHVCFLLSDLIDSAWVLSLSIWNVAWLLKMHNQSSD